MFPRIFFSVILSFSIFFLIEAPHCNANPDEQLAIEATSPSDSDETIPLLSQEKNSGDVEVHTETAGEEIVDEPSSSSSSSSSIAQQPVAQKTPAHIELENEILSVSTNLLSPFHEVEKAIAGGSERFSSGISLLNQLVHIDQDASMDSATKQQKLKTLYDEALQHHDFFQKSTPMKVDSTQLNKPIDGLHPKITNFVTNLLKRQEIVSTYGGNASIGAWVFFPVGVGFAAGTATDVFGRKKAVVVLQGVSSVFGMGLVCAGGNYTFETTPHNAFTSVDDAPTSLTCFVGFTEFKGGNKSSASNQGSNWAELNGKPMKISEKSIGIGTNVMKLFWCTGFKLCRLPQDMNYFRGRLGLLS